MLEGCIIYEKNEWRNKLECPSWSKGVDLRSSVFSHSWVRTPPLAFFAISKRGGTGWRKQREERDCVWEGK